MRRQEGNKWSKLTGTVKTVSTQITSDDFFSCLFIGKTTEPNTECKMSLLHEANNEQIIHSHQTEMITLLAWKRAAVNFSLAIFFIFFTHTGKEHSVSSKRTFTGAQVQSTNTSRQLIGPLYMPLWGWSERENKCFFVQCCDMEVLSGCVCVCVCERERESICRVTHHTTGADYTLEWHERCLSSLWNTRTSCLRSWILNNTSVAEERGAVLNMPSATVTQCLKNYMVQQSVCDPNYRGALMYVLFGKSFKLLRKAPLTAVKVIRESLTLPEVPNLQNDLHSVIIRKHERHHQPKSMTFSQWFESRLWKNCQPSQPNGRFFTVAE